MIEMHISFFFILLLLFPHAFVEYRVNIYVSSAHQSLSELLIETVEKIYSNDTFSYNLTVLVLNFSEIFPYTILYDNLTCPTQFFFISNPGKAVISREVILSLINESNGNFVYYGKSYIGYNEFDWYYFVNSTGVPYKIVLIQKNEYGQIVSNSTYILISSNIISSKDKLIIPTGFKFVNGSLASSELQGNINSVLDDSVGGYIILFNLILIPLLIGVRAYVYRHKKRYSN